MHEIEWHRQDLNLLVALDVLLEERSVTRAARRLGLTTSATSHALARCRDWLGDPLLVRTGRTMTTTPRAARLGPRIRAILVELGHTLAEEPSFDPARSTRRLSLVCADLLAAFLPELLATFGRDAPGVDLDVVSPTNRGVVATLLDGSHDLGLGGPPPTGGEDVRARTLGTVRLALLVRSDHPLAQGPVDLERWLAWPHVVVRGGPGPGIVGSALAALGRQRRIGLTIPSFALGPHALIGTDLVLAAPRELAAPLCGPFGLRLLDLPIEVPAIPVVMSWPERLQADPGHRWLRDRVGDVVRAALSADVR